MKNVFDENPRLEKCYVTSDGNAFYNETDAKAYAKTLEDKEVEILLNEKLIDVTDADAVTDEDKEMQEFNESELANKKVIDFVAGPVTDPSADIVETKSEAPAEPVTPKAKK